MVVWAGGKLLASEQQWVKEVTAMLQWIRRVLGLPLRVPTSGMGFSWEPYKTMAQLTEEGRTRLTTCMACHAQTPIPTDLPPSGLSLVCQHCLAPLVHVSEESDSVRAELIQRVFGWWNRCLIHARCPWCNEINYAIAAPANCRYGGHVERDFRHPNVAFAVQTACGHCGKGFCVEWD